jgi:membrane protein YdbS with pleckstrin-like domain
MLMTRFLLITSSILILALNGMAFWHVVRAEPPLPAIVGAALIVTAAAWPLALVFAYRIGQATARLARHKKRPGPEDLRA